MLAAAAVMMPSSMALIGQACPVTVASLTTSGNTDQLVYTSAWQGQRRDRAGAYRNDRTPGLLRRVA
jgi:hypothetical protein